MNLFSGEKQEEEDAESRWQVELTWLRSYGYKEVEISFEMRVFACEDWVCKCNMSVSVFLFAYCMSVCEQADKGFS